MMRTLGIRTLKCCMVLALAACLLPARGWAQLVMLPPPVDPSAHTDEDAPPGPNLNTLAGRVEDMLVKGQYDDIERIADKARREKTRLPGGAWRLRHVYAGLHVGPSGDYEAHMARLQAWIGAYPESITARVALANAWHRWAWVARGGGVADTVTPGGLKLFNERIAMSHRTLDEAAKLDRKCPQWYTEMQTVALAEGWDQPKTAALFAQAVKFEPEYFYYYTDYANYLQPKWEGEPGQAFRFATQSADAVGGQQGDFLYFEIGALLLGFGNGKMDVHQMDWARLQRGHAALDRMYGQVPFDMNQLAMMAYRFKDVAVAKYVFAELGTRWSKNVWKTKPRFDVARNWAEESPDPATGAAPPTVP
jgi:hypothetical protein